MSTLKNLKKGDEGYEYFESLFSSVENYSLLKGSSEQDQHQGIDGFIINKEEEKITANIDVKNTHDLYFLNYFPETKYVSVRHPFRKTSRTTHVAIVSTNKTKEGFYGFYTKEQWVSHFVKKEKIQDFLKQLSILESGDLEAYIGTTKSTSQAVYKLKLALQPYLKNNCYISYDEPSENEERISFKIYSSKPHYDQQVLTDEMIRTIGEEKEPVLASMATESISTEKYHKVKL